MLFLSLAILFIVLFRLPTLFSILVPVPVSHATSDGTIYIFINVRWYCTSVFD